jgi:hypothetical protein
LQSKFEPYRFLSLHYEETRREFFRSCTLFMYLPADGHRRWLPRTVPF